MKLINLWYFKMSVDCGSFSKAAQKMKTSQSAVSKRVTILEKELGMLLVIRPRSFHEDLTMTPEGKQVYKYCLNIFEAEKSIRKLSKEMNHNSHPQGGKA